MNIRMWDNDILPMSNWKKKKKLCIKKKIVLNPLSMDWDSFKQEEKLN